ncbi:alpha/beta fold hydrolase [Acuticoccus sp. I52.16.1]|uniref:alpha/beta fold hydrolase n=1 Tax=Acuticoccus sp. I52.16.1 TaxID=2928472 RepID=UPI001FD33151|nr:alpha/beta hydrolase [Acuticoccus sp. I52.16.1]UOM33018.1 alpha/beta hydrolase [Acuticoccus sp. I52.16.1]
MQTWLLIHGAWHGSWCWETVRHLLEAEGDTVWTPTLTGLGDRAGLMSTEITLRSWVDEVERFMIENAVAEAVVVGHSFAGSVVSGLAEAAPGRIDRLIYLDAMLLEGGETVFGSIDPKIVAERRAKSEAFSGGLSMPPPPAAAFGIRDPEAAAYLEARLTPHPYSTYVSPLALERPPGDGFACTYVACTDPPYGPLSGSRERARAYGWDYREMATGHDMMLTDPAGTVRLLKEIAGR